MNQLKNYLLKLNYDDPSEIKRVIPLFEKYMINILENNENVNVTSIREREPFIRKHYMDSVSIIEKQEFIKAKNIIDIGTGGGFPGIPLALLFKKKNFTLVDSVGKKINIIKKSLENIDCENVTFIKERAENMGRMTQHRGMYDLCVSRAVAPLNYLLEFSLPLLKKGGYFIAYKGPGGIKEIENAEGILKILGGSLNRVDNIEPFIEAENH